MSEKKAKAISQLADLVASQPSTWGRSPRPARPYLYEPHLVWPILVGETVETEHTSWRAAVRTLAEIFGVDLKEHEDFL